MSDPLRSVVERHLDHGAAPGASWAVGGIERCVSGHAGQFSLDAASPPVDDTTLWDLASLTKVVATTTVIKSLVESSVLTLDTPVCDVAPGFNDPRPTVRHLLTHQSGLPAYDRALAEQNLGREATIQAILNTSLESVPGTETVYSCLGFIALMHIAERVTGRAFNDLVLEALSTVTDGTVSATEMTFYPLDVTRCPPTCLSLHAGAVHDPLARALGGVSGNAGLFGTVDSVARFAQGVLAGRAPYDGESGKAWMQPVTEEGRTLGWDTTQSGVADGYRFGHLGFTGTSLWIDPVGRTFTVLLTNRTLLDEQDNSRIMEMRREFEEAARKSFRS